jgi:hypothetical protein
MRAPALIAAAFLAAAAFYGLLIDTAAPAELGGLAAVALLAAGAYAAAREERTPDAASALRCLRHGWRPFIRILGAAILPCLAIALLAGVADALVAFEVARGLATSARSYSPSRSR